MRGLCVEGSRPGALGWDVRVTSQGFDSLAPNRGGSPLAAEHPELLEGSREQGSDWGKWPGRAF